MNKLNCILLVDDSESINFYNEYLIKKMECTNEVITKHNGHEAIEFLKEAKLCPDLVLLDINMPVMNGWEFIDKCKELGLQKPNHRCKVVMLTTSINDADKERAKQIPEITAFVSKPISADILSNIIQEHLSEFSSKLPE